ncbi:cytochrome oxidase I, partial [Haloferax sp. Atlit-10N]
MRTTDDPWSATADSVRQSMREQRGSGSEAVVATVVNVEESGYRRPGARMVVVPDGERLGAVTAGCITE